MFLILWYNSILNDKDILYIQYCFILTWWLPCYRRYRPSRGYNIVWKTRYIRSSASLESSLTSGRNQQGINIYLLTLGFGCWKKEKTGQFMPRKRNWFCNISKSVSILQSGLKIEKHTNLEFYFKTE